jgi:adenine-specific DNA-methyltransferase
MGLKLLTPRQSINKAFLRVRPARKDIDLLKENASVLLDHINPAESEEFHKNLLSEFLRKTYYGQSYFINTKDRKDLVIHNDKDAKSSVGVIIETKGPTNKNAMPRPDRPDVRALQELVLYYLRERKGNKNFAVKHVVATNIYEWVIFDSQEFERVFLHDKKLVEQFEEFDAGRLSGKTTEFFYSEIASPAIKRLLAESASTLPATYIDLREHKFRRGSIDGSDAELIALFKVLSPQHLLKLPFENDSNTLDAGFYKELLYLIGLVEEKEGGKLVIRRRTGSDRHKASLIEAAIDQLRSLDKIQRLDDPARYGATQEQQLFNVALELSITWINRVLFLKLLEGQLIRFHKGDNTYAFLRAQHVGSYNDLNNLFFSVLARKPEEREGPVAEAFAKVPYLNSTLFEPTDLEQVTVVIGNLDAKNTLPVLPTTVLKDTTGKRRKGALGPLRYLIDFLDCFDFSSEGSEDIQEENKTLINASVLGLLFEKINGYRDGSYFTPGAVTMHMAREAARSAVIQKFNELKGWNCQTDSDLYNRIEDKKEANEIINGLRIVDPAVGSGHFLVSVLNELLAIKSDLKLLTDKNGRALRDYAVEVVNDELVVTDEDGRLFEYRPTSKESQRVQETLFREKRALIESCLFGVDINPNSVKICRLRLWIELLKNAYYIDGDVNGALETLPNLDVNVKAGNSLINRLPLREDEGGQFDVKRVRAYRQAISDYWRADEKSRKRELEKRIETIKKDFRTEIYGNDPKMRRLQSRKDELRTLLGQGSLFEDTRESKTHRLERKKKLSADIERLEAEIEEIRSNKVFEDAFEWRIEFPEALDEEGRFVGFDVVIGNPPYIDSETMVKHGLDKQRRYIASTYSSAQGNWDIYMVFLERGFDLLDGSGQLLFITPDKWLSKDFGARFREDKIKNIQSIVKLGRDVFQHALVDSIITRVMRHESAHVSAFRYESGAVQLVNKIAKKSLRKPFALDSVFSEQIALLGKIDAIPDTLERFAACESACATSDAYKLKPLIDEFDGKKHRGVRKYFKVVNTGTLDKYTTKWDVRPMTYLKDKYSKPIVSREEFKDTFNETYCRRSASPKIIMKGLTLLDAALDLEGDIVPGKSTLVIPSNDVETLKFLCGVLNSSLAIAYIKEKYSASSYNGGIVFSKDMINGFPLPNPEASVRKRVVRLVDKILVARSRESDADIWKWQEEIDSIVCSLYDLADEDIRRIEAGGKKPIASELG